MSVVATPIFRKPSGKILFLKFDAVDHNASTKFDGLVPRQVKREKIPYSRTDTMRSET
jgi:hypothetical protein